MGHPLTAFTPNDGAKACFFGLKIASGKPALQPEGKLLA